MDYKYSIVKELSVNSTTKVYKATRLSDQCPVVLKVFDIASLCGHMVRKIQIEGEEKVVPNEHVFLEKVKHIPGCVQLLDFIDESSDGKWILVLEDLDSLGYVNLAKSVIRSEVLMEESTVSWILRELVFALLDIHSAGILHCDIKPDNTFINFDLRSVKVIDFNVSIETDQIQNNLVSGGTPEYTPPEVLVQRRPWTAAGDVWSLGCTAFVLLCKRFPFENPQMAAISSPIYPLCIAENAYRHFNSLTGNRHFGSCPSFKSSRISPCRMSANGEVYISPSAKDFLLHCLCRIPENRASLESISKHAFLTSHNTQQNIRRAVSDCASLGILVT